MVRVVKLTELIEALSELPAGVLERLAVEVLDGDGPPLVRFHGRQSDTAAALAALRARPQSGTPDPLSS